MKKFTALTTLTVAALALLSACAPKEADVKPASSSSKTETTTKVTKFTVGAMPAPDSLPLYVAEKEGFFKAQHLDVKLQSFKSPKDRDAAIAGGQLNAAVTDILAFTTYTNGDLGWKIGTGLTGYFGIVTSNDQVKSVADLKGKTAATTPRQTPTFYLDQQLEAAGLTPEDVTIQDVPPIPVRLQLVEAKKADLTILPDPFLSMAKAKGLRVIKQSDPKTYQSTLLAFDKTLSADPATRTRFYKAYNQAVKAINDHKASDYQDILTKDLGFPEPVAAKFTLPTYTKAKAVPAKMVADAFSYAHKNGTLKTDVDPESFQLSVEVK